ncbi:MAG: dTDP-glucose 4,6-dehydratase [Candidatus Omnitrophota bacterium]
MKQVLITGGAGFIGSNFVEYFIQKYPSCKIVNVDKLTYAGSLENLKNIFRHRNHQFIQADICDAKKMNQYVRGCDAIIHFAAETHVDRSITDAHNFIKTNVFGTYVLLEAAVRNKIKRFIHISTDEVYGSRHKGFFKENDPLHPSSPYSTSKAAGDLLVQSYYTTYQLPILITRSSNNFGPRQYPEKVIPLFVTNLLKNKKVPLYADGENIRDWIYVLDNCRAIDCVVQKGKIGEIYNIAGGNYLTNLSLTKKMLIKMKKSESMIQRVKDRPGHDFRYAIDCSKIKCLGFKPLYRFDQGLDLTIEWYKNNPLWLKRIKKG